MCTLINNELVRLVRLRCDDKKIRILFILNINIIHISYFEKNNQGNILLLLKIRVNSFFFITFSYN